MNEVAQKEYQDLLEEVHKIEETSAATTAKLRGLGRRLVDFGRMLEKIDTIPSAFDHKGLEYFTNQIPALVEEHQANRAKKLDLESRLTRLSWHRS